MAQAAFIRAAATPKARQIHSTSRYDWVMLFLSTWMLAGFYSDAFAHEHRAIDSFFTPWHATIYSGLTAVICFDVITLIGNHLKGYPWRKAVPSGYTISFIGAALFAVAGLGDFIWHSLFGIEFSLDAVLSPSHLAAMAAAVLVIIGPVCALWKRGKTRQLTWSVGLPALLSVAYLLVMVDLVTSFVQPFKSVDAAQTNQMIDAAAIASFIVATAIFTGFTLSILRRWQLPFGAMTVIITLPLISATLLSSGTAANVQTALVAIAILSGIAADLLLWWLKPGPNNFRAYRWFATLVPIVMYSLYFLAIQLTSGIAWTIHSWSGLIVVSGAVGLVMSFLVFPPRLPEFAE